MNTFITNISESKELNQNITEKIKEISDFHHHIFQKLSFNSPLITQNNTYLLKYYNLLQIVINFFITCINLFQNLERNSPVDEQTLISLTRAFNTFFINISLSKDFMIKQNSNNSCLFIDIIVCLWNIIKYKQFNCTSRVEMRLCYYNAIQYDINLFNIAFEKCLIKSNKYTQDYIKSIIEYFIYFQNDQKQINNMLDFLIENTQGNAEIDIRSFSFFLSLVARKKGLKKVNK